MTEDAAGFLRRLEADASLFDPEQLQKRLEVLDVLDIRFGDGETLGEETEGRIYRRAAAMRKRLEAANARLFESIRFEIRQGAGAAALLPWVGDAKGRDRMGNRERKPASGLGFDFRDELVSGILQLREPCGAKVDREPERMFYQPTPVRHILSLICGAGLTRGDVLVDLGSGLGHVSLLASMLAGARSLGIEAEPAYVTSARDCAARLNLTGVEFIQQDARAADLSSGTVFYLYSPFTGSMLTEVLERLRVESTLRPIRVCTLGPCTRVVSRESWLMRSARPDPEQVTVFESLQLCGGRREPAGGLNPGWGARSWHRR